MVMVISPQSSSACRASVTPARRTPKHHGQELVRGGEVIPVHPVVAHQQPTRETLFKGVASVGQCGLTHLDHERLYEPQQTLVQRGTGRHRSPKVVSPDPQALA